MSTSFQTVYVTNPNQPAPLNPNMISYSVPVPTLQPALPITAPTTTHDNHRHWQSNICDCCVNPGNCLKAFLCPCCAFGNIVNHVKQEKNCCQALCCCLCPCSVFIRAPYRKQLRVKHNLPAKPCNDCCTSFWCPCCALAQELQEIDYNKRQNPLQQTMK